MNVSEIDSAVGTNLQTLGKPYKIFLQFELQLVIRPFFFTCLSLEIHVGLFVFAFSS